MTMRCPEKCSGSSINRQSDFSATALASLPETDRERILAVTSTPRRCTYCSCVYSEVPLVIFGWYGSDLLPNRWTPKTAR